MNNISINKILKDNKLTKREKIKKMFYIIRDELPEDSNEEIFELCVKYYNYKKGKCNPDKIRF